MKPGWEKRDITPGRLFVMGALLLGLIGLALAVPWVIFRFDPRAHRLVDSVMRTRDRMAFDVRAKFPEPRLQVSPSRDWAEYAAAERRLLDGYGWVDRRGGIVRIPVDRAMAIRLRRGFPARREAP